MITLDQMRKLTSVADQALTDAFNRTAERYDINTPRRLRYFIAQAAFETQGFTKFVENLYYSNPERIVAVWPRRFSMQRVANKAYAPDYAKNPEKLANLVYGDRNGNLHAGDGWAYRGRGGFHLTFKDNYRECSIDLYGDERLVEDPDLVAQHPDAILTAGWFWHTRDLNELADADDFTRTTKVINGSDVTVPQRLVTLRKVNSIF